jgi:hypothetical protein
MQGDTRYGNLNNFSTNADGQLSTSTSTALTVQLQCGFILRYPFFCFE